MFHSVKIGELLQDSTLDFGRNTVLEAFSRGFKSMQEKYAGLGKDSYNSSPFNPSDIFQKIARKWKVYSQYRQQDSHELLIRILDLMDHESKTVIFNL